MGPRKKLHPRHPFLKAPPMISWAEPFLCSCPSPSARPAPHSWGPDTFPLVPPAGPMSLGIAFVLADRPLGLTSTVTEDGSLPDGFVRLAFETDVRRIGQAICPADAAREIVASGLVAVPRLLGFLAEESTEGVRCTLMALIPSDEFAGIAEEVGRRSEDGGLTEFLIHYPAGTIRDADLFPFDMVALGRVLRPVADRQYPDNLTDEATDMLARLLFDTGYASADRRAIDTLLGSI